MYSYTAPNPGADGFKAFYDLIMSIFQNIGISPTYFAAEGVGYKGDLTKFGGRIHAKAIKSGFTDIHVMSLVANPEGSAEPGYDSYASASLGYVEETGETLLCIAIEESFLEFGGAVFENIFRSLIGLRVWDFGYALSQPIEKKPEFHVLGLDGGKLASEDRRRLNKWYASLPGERLRKIRDVYPFNVVNAAQLGAKISTGQTLEEVIRQDVNSSLASLEGGRLWLWKVQSGGLGNIRDRLVDGDALIT